MRFSHINELLFLTSRGRVPREKDDDL